ncbi:MAG: hypothetical protein ABEJ72_09430, partial [Candidatus Aenigmatarchaeota archaeon]
RFLFSETKPNKEFSIPFDEDIFQIYERFDKIEDVYFNPGKIENDRKREHWKRVYELAIVDTPDEQPVRVPFQHAAFVAQTVPEEEWDTKAIESLERTGHIENPSEKEVEQVLDRLERAKNWARQYAPEDYRYHINFEVPDEVVENLSDDQLEAMKLLKQMLEETNVEEAEELDGEIFEVKDESELGTGEFFNTSYQVLLSREQGPRLSTLVMSIGKQQTVEILEQVE